MTGGVWQQNYALFGQGIGVSALLAALPVFVLLFLLGVLRKPAWMAALAAWIAALVLAVGGFAMPARLATSASLYGAAFGIFPITWIIFWAIALYRVTAESGNFYVIHASLGGITRDMRLQALLIAFAFGAFLEGAAGFGTPVAIASAMLAGLGFTPFLAAAVCLIANTAPVAFGSIGIPVVTLAGITGLPLNPLSARIGLICVPLALIVPGYLVVLLTGWRRALVVWPAIVLAGVTFSASQYLISTYLGPHLTDIVSALLVFAVLLLFLRMWRPASVLTAHDAHVAEATADLPRERDRPTARQVVLAWMPYGLLVAFVVLWGLKPAQILLGRATRIVPWPLLHLAVERMPPAVAIRTPYPALYQLNWLAASGTACMFATIAAALLLGYRPRPFLRLLLAVCRQLLLPTLTVALILSMAFVMNYSGATATLGLAFAASGALFPFFSPLLGWLGTFLTGSDTSSNALFGSLQVVTATRLGFDPVLMAAASSAGGVLGKMISLQSIVVAGAATNMPQAEQTRLFRFTLRHSVLLVLFAGFEVLALAYWFGRR